MDEISVPFVGFDLCDNDAVRKYHDHLGAARNMAQLKPMEPGVRFDIDLVIPPANPHPNARSLPPLPIQSSSKFTLCLDLPLQTDLDRFSQVWTAVVEGFGAARSATQTTLVLKIIQPSMCPYFDIDDNWVGNYTFPEYTARLEAMVYDRLANKQGLSIPYFFGIHTILTPSNEIAWALVLEYIPGQTLQTYADSTNKTIQESCELVCSSRPCIYASLSCTCS
ncbi:hypothetical protein GGX14DRAFT_377846 [Mycena pura]|uniref:Uncharacterized protein n=1 Tax=Mycena pura TaxID=153505 RepID=A0AAD6UU70_9AGAR|nr:hypothetical protein GGX14DRAFT_377846 [Mycena pura]